MSDIASSSTPVQIEATRFRSSVSEALLQLIGGNVNYLLGAVLPVGSVIASMLSQSQMQAQSGAGWIVSDGRTVTGSDYALLTGNTTVPDLRGVFIRGKNSSPTQGNRVIAPTEDAGAGWGNQSGDLALGTYQHVKNVRHYHYNHDGTESESPDNLILDEGNGTIERDEGSEYRIERVTEGGFVVAPPSSGSIDIYELAPRCVTLNYFIRIN